MKNTPIPDIDVQAADALFREPEAIETLLMPELPDIVPASETPVMAQAARTPDARVQVPARAESLMRPTIAALKQSLSNGRSRKRRRPAFAYGRGIEGLEERALMSGVAAEVRMLQPSDLSWSQGKDDATKVLGKADFLPGSNLYDVVLSPDGTKAVVAGQFSKASIIDPKTGTVITPLGGHTSSVINVAWTPDGSEIFTASYDKRVRQYTASGLLLWTSDNLGQLVVGVEVSPDGKSLFVRRHEMQPLIFDLATKTSKTINTPSSLADLDVLEDGTVLILENDSRYQGPNNRAHIINPTTGTTEWMASFSGRHITTAASTPNGAYVFVGTDDGSIIMYDREKGTSVGVAGRSSYVRDLVMDKTGTFLIAATGGNLAVFDVAPLMAGTGNAVPTIFPLGSISVTVSGTVALINNAYDGASSRTLAIDLSQIPNWQTRLDALTKHDEPEEEAEALVEPVTETMMETVTEAKKIDFSSLEQGVHPESWTTNIEGLGSVTLWFQGGVNVDGRGISAVTQPWGGTSWSIKLNDSAMKMMSAELNFNGTSPKGQMNLAYNGDNVRENGLTKYFPLGTNVDFGGRNAVEIMAGQREGNVALKSLTVEVTVTREVNVAESTPDEEEVIAEQDENDEVVLAPVTVSVVKNASNAAQGIFITSPFDESFLMSEHYGLITAQHKGGAKDLMIFNNYLSDMMSNVYGNKTKTLTLFADKEMQVPVSEITFIGNRNFGVQLLSAIALPVQKSMLPEGQEYEKAPEFHVAHLEGPNVILEVSSPLANSTIQFVDVHDQSLLGHATVIQNPRGGMNPVSITINPANATGDYNLIMKGADGRVFGRALLHWDKDTKQLSLPAGQTAWTASEADQPGLDAAMAGLKTSLVDFTTSDRALAAIQQQILLTAASSMPGMSQDFDAAFFSAHPEWAPALRECATPSELQQFNDTYGILRADFSTFQGLLGDLLKQSSKLITDIRNGGNETELRRLFDITVDKYATSLPMYRLASIGIKMPIGSVILEGAKNAGSQAAEALHAMKHKNLLQTMNKQAYANNGLVVSKDGTYMVSNDPRLETMKYYVDNEGRLSLLDPRGARTLVANLHGAADVQVEEITETDDNIALGERKTIDIPNLSLLMKPEGYKVFTFELTQESMVNLDVWGVKNRNLSLTIQGTKLPPGGYTSNKSKDAGESISLRLLAGTYTFTMNDMTDYKGSEIGYAIPRQPFNASVTLSAVEFNSANIEGKISIEGSDKVMPVRMRVAEFLPNGQRNDNYKGTDVTKPALTKLDPTKPVWVVIHGREDRDDSGKMLELQKALTDSGYQVVTIDWRDAAGLNVPESVGMQSESWIQAIADWSFRALKAAGVQGVNTRIGGHSFGSFIGFEIGEHFKAENGFGVDTFIALDSAKDPTLSIRYDASQVDFAAVSKTSTAIHSSFWGSPARANTAEHTIELRSPVASYDVFENQTRKHGLAVTTFANLIRLKKIDPTNDIAEQFAFQSSENSTLPEREGVDGWLFVASALKNGTGPSDAFIDAIPHKMTFTDPDDDIVDSYMFNTLLNLNHSISQQ